MIQKTNNKNNRKRERLKINCLNEFKEALKKEGYNINQLDEEKFKEEVSCIFNLDYAVLELLYTCMKDSEITYRANNIRDFIDYIEKMMLFENAHNKLCEKIRKIKKLHIDRIEYDRVQCSKENVENIIKQIENIKDNISEIITVEEKCKLEMLEKEIDYDCIYTKDIELLKKMLTYSNDSVEELYDEETKIKTLLIEMPIEISSTYIKVKKGSVEYHEHLNRNIPRMERLIKNIDKYLEENEEDKTSFKIDQSKIVQDTINIAVATFDGREFKAVSGSNDITDYCIAPSIEEVVFESCKVNKLGKLGVGYKRVNDSEKKILEEIHKQIKDNNLSNNGDLILYSKWEPCPSCYFVISQFCIIHPNIKVHVKYSKKYGEE